MDVVLEQDRRFMQQALELAMSALRAGEVPVGAVIVRGGRTVGWGRNATLSESDPTAHAEIMAIRRAAAELGNHRLTQATLYCTVEPCLMCLGAMTHARIVRLVFGAGDPKLRGAARIEAMRALGAAFNHRFQTVGGVLGQEATELLVGFFRERRAPAHALRTVQPNGEVPKWS